MYAGGDAKQAIEFVWPNIEVWVATLTDENALACNREYGLSSVVVKDCIASLCIAIL